MVNGFHLASRSSYFVRVFNGPEPLELRESRHQTRPSSRQVGALRRTSNESMQRTALCFRRGNNSRQSETLLIDLQPPLRQDAFRLSIPPSCLKCFSPVSVAQPTPRDKPALSWVQMNVCALDFPDESFNTVIDKGTLDSVLCGEGSTANVAKMCMEISRVLKPNGVYFICSYGVPDNRLQVRYGHLSRQPRSRIRRARVGRGVAATVRSVGFFTACVQTYGLLSLLPLVACLPLIYPRLQCIVLSGELFRPFSRK